MDRHCPPPPFQLLILTTPPDFPQRLVRAPVAGVARVGAAA